MQRQNTFTSILPHEILSTLGEYSQKFSLPKNRIIEKALDYTLKKLNKLNISNHLVKQI